MCLLLSSELEPFENEEICESCRHKLEILMHEENEVKLRQ